MSEFSEKDLLLLAYLEGDMSPEEKAAFEEVLENDRELRAEYRLLEKTKLVPEPVVFAGKAALKRPVVAEQPVPVVLQPVKAPRRISLKFIVLPAAVAASIALFLVFSNPQNTSGDGNVAVNNPVKPNENAVAVNPPVEEQTEKNTDAALQANNTAPAKHNKGGDLSGGARPVITSSVPANEQPGEKDGGESGNDGKHLEMAPSLHAKTFEAPELNKGEESMRNMYYHKFPKKEMDLEEEVKGGWFAQTKTKVGQFLGLIDNPRLRLKKQENSGKYYWALTLETDAYEVEGRLYTRK